MTPEFHCRKTLASTVRNVEKGDNFYLISGNGHLIYLLKFALIVRVKSSNMWSSSFNYPVVYTKKIDLTANSIAQCLQLKRHFKTLG